MFNHIGMQRCSKQGMALHCPLQQLLYTNFSAKIHGRKSKLWCREYTKECCKEQQWPKTNHRDTSAHLTKEQETCCWEAKGSWAKLAEQVWVWIVSLGEKQNYAINSNECINGWLVPLKRGKNGLNKVINTAHLCLALGLCCLNSPLTLGVTNLESEYSLSEVDI